MITIYFGRQDEIIRRPDVIGAPNSYYKEQFQKAWYDDPFVLRILHDIDHIPEDSGPMIMWLLDHNRYPWDICTGSKNLIMAKYVKDRAPLLQYMGENCFPYLFELSNCQDITVWSSVAPMFLSKLWNKVQTKIYAPQFNLTVENSRDTVRLYLAARDADMLGM